MNMLNKEHLTGKVIAKVMATGLIAMSLSSCGETAKLSTGESFGAQPNLSQLNKKMIPTVNVAKAVGWPVNAKPIAAQGTTVAAFASDLVHPRWLYELPNGDVLVAETAHIEKSDGFSFKGWMAGLFMSRAGSTLESPNRISLLRDTNDDGIADKKFIFLKDLNSPFGMALIGNDFYVANADAVVKFPYEANQTNITSIATKVVDLPAGRNHHWTKNLLASKDGTKLYVAVGSNSNIAEHGMAEEKERAAILEIDLKTGSQRIFASGLRNPVGLTWEPDSGEMWVSVNERDELGSDLVPDYMTSVKDGGFYGWPYSYYGQNVDTRVQPQKPELVASAIVPDYALGTHTASLGLTAAKGNKLPEAFANGMFIGQHGSWNRKPYGGYKVIFVPFIDGKPAGEPVNVLTGFLNDKGEAQGRPVGVLVNKKGGLLVADDVGNTVWLIK